MIMLSNSEFKYMPLHTYILFLSAQEDFSSKLRQQLFDYIASGCLEENLFSHKRKQIIKANHRLYKQYENTAMIKRKCSCCFYMEEYHWYEGLFANTPKIDFFCLQLIFQIRMESTISARDFTMVL